MATKQTITNTLRSASYNYFRIIDKEQVIDHKLNTESKLIEHAEKYTPKQRAVAHDLANELGIEF